MDGRRLLLDRRMCSHGVAPEGLSLLSYGAFWSGAGVGALAYEPERAGRASDDNINLDTLAEQAEADSAAKDCRCVGKTADKT